MSAQPTAENLNALIKIYREQYVHKSELAVAQSECAMMVRKFDYQVNVNAELVAALKEIAEPNSRIWTTEIASKRRRIAEAILAKHAPEKE